MQNLTGAFWWQSYPFVFRYVPRECITGDQRYGKWNKKDDSLKQQNSSLSAKEVAIEDEIIKTMYYDLKPMHPEDAKLKLQEKPANQFLVYVDIDTQKVNVLFKLKDGKNYGLVEPEA